MSDAMVVCPQPIAAEAARDVLLAGGNAVDAAVTAGLVQGVLDPQMCGLGGGGCMLVHLHDGRDEVIEFYPRAGSLVTEDQWANSIVRAVSDRYGYILEGNRNDVGYESIAVPGTVRGFANALSRHGTMSWRDVVSPAVSLARDGFEVPGALAGSWSGVVNPELVAMRERIQATAESRRLYTREGVLLGSGAVLRQPDLARVLEQIGREGPEDFYTGEIGQRIAGDLAANGSSIAAADLAAYTAEVTKPLRGTYLGRVVVTVPPPGGGVCVLQMLNFLEALELDLSDWPSARGVAELAEAMAWAFADRDRSLADPKFWPVPVDRMLSKDEARAAAARFATGHKLPSYASEHEPATTTQICVVDADGSAVSLTHTLGSSSGVVTPGLGFSFNNYLNTFDPLPARPNSLAPAKTRFTMMSPTMVLREGEVQIVIGAPGGTKIAGAIVQVLVHLIDRGLELVEAVSAPRVDYQSGVIEAEGRFPGYIVDELSRRGYTVHRRPTNYDTYFAQVQVITIGQGRARGASDPRRDGGMAIRIGGDQVSRTVPK